MGSPDQVAALPGGGAFEALWQQVDGDPAAIGDLAAALSTAGTHLGQTQQSLGTAVVGVADGWTGPAATSFGHYMGTVSQASAEVHEAMSRAATELRTAAEAVTTAKAALTRVADEILDEVAGLRTLERDTAHLLDVVLDELIAEKVQQGCGRAQPAVTVLTTALQQAAGGVRAAGSAGGYAALRLPGDGAYLPAGGGAIQWQAVPKDGATTPTGTGSTGSGSTGSGSTGSGSSGHGASGSGGAGASGGAGTSGHAPASMPSGNVKTWIDQAIAILEQNGVPAKDLDPAAINLIIQHESSGNPHAENDWDSNAAAGHPSKGLMQTIDSTFDAHALPGHKDIWNPVDNIIAGVRYAISRYGSLSNVPGVKAVHDGGSYVGY